MMLGYARSVVIVPGYGMAVAQAQHSVRELADRLDGMGSMSNMQFTPLLGGCQGI